MKAVGVLTTLSLSALVLGVAVIGVRSIPDIQRYLKIRAM